MYISKKVIYVVNHQALSTKLGIKSGNQILFPFVQDNGNANQNKKRAETDFYVLILRFSSFLLGLDVCDRDLAFSLAPIDIDRRD